MLQNLALAEHPRLADWLGQMLRLLRQNRASRPHHSHPGSQASGQRQNRAWHQASAQRRPSELRPALVPRLTLGLRPEKALCWVPRRRRWEAEALQEGQEDPRMMKDCWRWSLNRHLHRTRPTKSSTPPDPISVPGA